MSRQKGAQNRQVARTKGWILEALMTLIDEKPFSKITISDITQKAGIARQTFYRNYKSKIDVVFEYIMKTMHTDLLSFEMNKDAKERHDIVLSFNLAYIREHKERLKKILNIDEIERRILWDVKEWPLTLIESFKSKLTKEEYVICRCKICFQIAGCLRVFFDWFVNDMTMLSVKKLVSMLNKMTTPQEIIYRNIPNIVVKAK